MFEDGIDATYDGGTIKVFFDSDGEIIDGVGSREITARCKTSDVSNVARNSTIIIGGVTYYVMEFHHDVSEYLSDLELSINQGG
jgi:hypothetical protein